MTLASPESTGDPGAVDAPAGDSADGDIRPVVRQRVATRKRKRRRAVVVQTVLSVVFVSLLAGLAVVGYRSALKITGGTTDRVTDPTAPGYVAEVRPTSVQLIALTGGKWRADMYGPEALGAALLVIENGPDDVVVVPVPPVMTLGAFEDAPPASAEAVFAEGGTDVLQVRLGADLSFGPTSTMTVPIAAIESLANQVGPITIQNPDNVTLPTLDSQVIVEYPAGELTLEPADVALFLTVPGLAEDGSSRTLRSTAVYTELFRLLTERGGPDPIAGIEGDDVEEFSDLIERITGTEARFDLLPLVPTPSPTGDANPTPGIDIAAMPTWVSTHVGYPTSAYPGQRPTVAVLNGTTNDDAPQLIAPKVVFAGGEVTLFGNAESFEQATSVVRYFTPEAEPAAARIAAELGVSANLTESSTANVDVEVVVGKDLAP